MITKFGYPEADEVKDAKQGPVCGAWTSSPHCIHFLWLLNTIWALDSRVNIAELGHSIHLQPQLSTRQLRGFVTAKIANSSCSQGKAGA